MHPEERELISQKSIWLFVLTDTVEGRGNLSKKYSKIGYSLLLINSQLRSKRSYGHHKHHNKSFHSHTTVDLLKYIYGRSDGFHILCSMLYSVPLNLLTQLHNDISR